MNLDLEQFEISKLKDSYLLKGNGACNIVGEVTINLITCAKQLKAQLDDDTISPAAANVLRDAITNSWFAEDGLSDIIFIVDAMTRSEK